MISLLWFGILLMNKTLLKHDGLYEEGPVGLFITMFVDIVVLIGFYSVLFDYLQSVTI